MDKVEIVDVGSLPELGVVPEYMHAQVIRQDRFGEPKDAYKPEKIKVPEIADDEVLIAVKAAGVNYNCVWASTGYPVDVIKLREIRGEANGDFHIAGSDASGIVWKIGKDVKNVSVGDEIVVLPAHIDPNEPYLAAGGDDMLSTTLRAWGFETNWGSFAQFCKAKHFQCVPKPKHLSWAESSVYMLSGATAYRMLLHHHPHTVKKGDVVLIWGGSGGLGVMGIQLVKRAGGIPVAVVSSDERAEFCKKLGALTINRSNYSHWGALKTAVQDDPAYLEWRKGVKAFNKELLTITGGKAPFIVLEHPGEMTFPTSLFVCDPGGMVITCAGTTGYMASFDLRFLWIFKKRVQGSHGASVEEHTLFNDLVRNKEIEPIVSEVFPYDKIGDSVQKMYDNKHLPGSMAVLVGAKDENEGRS
ncbi:MAG: crotonyl-CoA carboxylase/reductase [Chitinophagales bacterium]|nr:crotonyl-CoA carboxylase/reductase [Chitinophagales bacterium]